MPEFNRGEAHVYRHDGVEWQHEARLRASDGDGADRFGGSVAVDGDVILVGAASDEHGEVSSAGSVYVFRFDGQAWTEEKKLVPARPVSAGVFDSAVALCGEVGLIGSAGAETSFIVRYVGAPDEWEFETELIPFDGYGSSAFGTEVAMDGNLAVVTAPFFGGLGAAFVFERVDERWTDGPKLLPIDPVGPSLLFGFRLDICEDTGTIVIGAPSDSPLGFDSGSAHVFRASGCGWEPSIKLTPSDGGPGDLFGAVGLDGDLAIIGATLAEKVYLFRGMDGIDCNENGQADGCDLHDGSSLDMNANGIPDECEVPGDVDSDGTVGFMDLLAVLSLWGPCVGGDPFGNPCGGH